MTTSVAPFKKRPIKACHLDVRYGNDKRLYPLNRLPLQTCREGLSMNMLQARVSETRIRHNSMATSPSSSKMAWVLCFEALANFKPVDTTLLRDLMCASGISESFDQPSRTARERISLRCLEQWLSVNNASDARVESSGLSVNNASDARVESSGFDYFERRTCEEVLRLVLNKTRMSETLKQDVQRFIHHKRASLPECALQQLKDSILDGTHPFSSAMWKRNGVVKVNQNWNIIQAVDNALAEPARIHSTSVNTDQAIGEKLVNPVSPENGKEPMQEEQEWNRSGLEHENQSKSVIPADGSESFERVLVHNNYGVNDIRAPQEKLICLASERNGTELLQEQPPGGNTKSSQCGVAKKMPVERHLCLDDVDHPVNRGSHMNCLKSRGHQSSDLKLDTVICETRNETLKRDPPDRVMTSTKRGRFTLSPERCILTNETPAQVTKEAEICGDGDECVPLKRLKNNSIDCEIQHNMPFNTKVLLTSNPVVSQQIIFDNAEDENNEMSLSYLNGSKEDVVNETENRNEGHAERETSSENVGHCDRTLYLNDTMLISAEKHRFLNSQCLYDHDSSATSDQKAERICCKCMNGGQLLICSVHSCRLVVHESCLGSSASFDNKANFHCPFCSYERAITAYHDSKKKAAMARKCLATFAGAGKSYLQKFETGSNSQEPQSRRTTNVELTDKNRDNRDQKANQLMQVVEHQREAEDAVRLLNGYLSCTKAKTSIGLERNDISLIEEHPKAVDDQQNKEVRKGQWPTEPLNACHNDDVPLREEETFAITEAPSVSPTAERGNANITEEPPHIGGEEEKKKQKFYCTEYISANLPCTNTMTVSSQKSSGHGTMKPVLQQQTVSPLPEPSSQPTVAAKEISDNENVSSDGSRRSQRPNIARRFPVLSSRRKNVPWSDEEEQMLLEGVRRFSSTDGKTVPWKRILEFGCHVFQKSRNPVDLKDKWRNICTKGDRMTK